MTDRHTKFLTGAFALALVAPAFLACTTESLGPQTEDGPCIRLLDLQGNEVGATCGTRQDLVEPYLENLRFEYLADDVITRDPALVLDADASTFRVENGIEVRLIQGASGLILEGPPSHDDESETRYYGTFRVADDLKEVDVGGRLDPVVIDLAELEDVLTPEEWRRFVGRLVIELSLGNEAGDVFGVTPAFGEAGRFDLIFWVGVAVGTIYSITQDAVTSGCMSSAYDAEQYCASCADRCNSRCDFNGPCPSGTTCSSSQSGSCDTYKSWTCFPWRPWRASCDCEVKCTCSGGGSQCGSCPSGVPSSCCEVTNDCCANCDHHES